MKLNQTLAIVKGLQGAFETSKTKAYHAVQKPVLFQGLTKTYQPNDEEGEVLPGEATLVQLKVPELIQAFSGDAAKLLNLLATKVWGNTLAKADVKLANGEVLLEQVPVEFLLVLEQHLTDVKTFLTKLPTLDPAQHWSWNEQTKLYDADPVQTVRNKKVPKAFVKAPGTDKHPAQVEVFHEDVKVGTWTKVDHSGAISEADRRQLLDRVLDLQAAVKMAREEANSIDVNTQNAGEKVFAFLFPEG